MVCATGRGVDAAEIVDELFSIVTGTCPSDFRSGAISPIAAEDPSLAAAALADRESVGNQVPQFVVQRVGERCGCKIVGEAGTRSFVVGNVLRQSRYFDRDRFRA
jgi:hypothetical protein